MNLTTLERRRLRGDLIWDLGYSKVLIILYPLTVFELSTAPTILDYIHEAIETREKHEHDDGHDAGLNLETLQKDDRGAKCTKQF